MVVFPNSKINLGLNILSKRDDGYHNIASCFYPVNFCDILEIIESTELKFESTGIDIPGDEQSNLCLKAYHLLKADFDLPPVHIYLHKIIPIGAGLGGGSADASFTLKALNAIFKLNIADENLELYAAKLGSDCPFFIKNKPVLATGTGNVFDEVNINLAGKYLVLVYPQIHVSTKEAYSGVRPIDLGQDLKLALSSPIDEWHKVVKNDFEYSVFNQYPEIEKVKETMYSRGALFASMTGSGSAVFGLFNHEVSDFKNAVWQGFLK